MAGTCSVKVYVALGPTYCQMPKWLIGYVWKEKHNYLVFQKSPIEDSPHPANPIATRHVLPHYTNYPHFSVLK